jgi:hypothetical protein
MSKIYDCFTFYNEFDILELRLQEHWDHVDKFVIAEANTTHQGNPKEFLLEQNWNRFKPYADKIVHIKVDDMPQHSNAWVPENFQRNALARGLIDADAEDLILVSDVDEMIRDQAFEYMKESDHDLFATRIPLFYFKLNYMMHQPSTTLIGAIGVRRKFLQTPQKVRDMGVGLMQRPWNYNDGRQCSIPHAGWHFSYFGNDEHVKNKIKNFAHRETNNDYILDQVNLEDIFKNKRGLDANNKTEKFEIVEIDEYFPNTIVNNLEKYSEFIIPNAEATVLDFLPTE